MSTSSSPWEMIVVLKKISYKYFVSHVSCHFLHHSLPWHYLTYSFPIRHHSHAAVNPQNRGRPRWQHQVLSHICQPGSELSLFCFFIVVKNCLCVWLLMNVTCALSCSFSDRERHPSEGGAGGGEEEPSWQSETLVHAGQTSTGWASFYSTVKFCDRTEARSRSIYLCARVLKAIQPHITVHLLVRCN